MSIAQALQSVDFAVSAVALGDGGSVHFRVGTALVWICSLEEALWPRPEDATYDADLAASEDGRVIPGLRRARNSLVHELVEPVPPEGGLEYPLFGATGRLEFTPRWVPLASLGPGDPTASKKRLTIQSAAYDAHVAGKPLAEPLQRAARWLGDHAEVHWARKLQTRTPQRG